MWGMIQKTTQGYAGGVAECHPACIGNAKTRHGLYRSLEHKGSAPWRKLNEVSTLLGSRLILAWFGVYYFGLTRVSRRCMIDEKSRNQNIRKRVSYYV